MGKLQVQCLLFDWYAVYHSYGVHYINTYKFNRLWHIRRVSEYFTVFSLCAVFPYYEILLFFILPVKIKYLAWIEWAFIGFTVLFFPLPQKLTAIASVINFLVFFGQDFVGGAKLRRQVYNNRRRFHDEIRKAEQARRKWDK
jgi:hypothetical protein